MIRKIIIAGGPRCGKSTLARQFFAAGIQTYCSDHPSKVKQLDPQVIYLPETVSWADVPGFVCREWLTKPGPWCCEGVQMVRCLRYLQRKQQGHLLHNVEVIYLAIPYEPWLAKQASMAKGISSIWFEVHGFVRQFAKQEDENAWDRQR